MRFLNVEVDERPGYYYVSMIGYDERVALLAGPYTTHIQAIDTVHVAREIARNTNAEQTAFSSFGTCRSETDLGKGVLHRLGLMSDPTPKA